MTNSVLDFMSLAVFHIDVNIVGDTVRAVHLLHTPVLASLCALEVELAVAHIFLTIVEVVNLGGDGTDKLQVQSVNDADVAVQFQEVTGMFLRLLFPNTPILVVTGLGDFNFAEVLPRDPLQAQQVGAKHFLLDIGLNLLGRSRGLVAQVGVVARDIQFGLGITHLIEVALSSQILHAFTLGRIHWFTPVVEVNTGLS